MNITHEQEIAANCQYALEVARLAFVEGLNQATEFCRCSHMTQCQADDFWQNSNIKRRLEHVWEVGQYALFKNESVFKVVSIRQDFLRLKGLNFWIGMTACIPCAEPPRPALPEGWGESLAGRISCNEVCLSLDAWIAALQADEQYPVLPQLLALKEWRELTGEM